MKDSNSKKIPSYVPIYNKLYSDITNDVYKDGDSLPSESILTKEYAVSRHTLRQALTVLSEDGLIRKEQGKGTIITKSKKNNEVRHKNFINPIIQYARTDINKITVDYNFAPPTEVAKNKLAISSSDIILASNNIYYSNETAIGHAFMQVPFKYIEKYNLDLNDTNIVSEYINKTMFEEIENAKVFIRLVLAEEHITKFLDISEKEPIIYIEEILYNKEDNALARCKFYFLPSAYDIGIWL